MVGGEPGFSGAEQAAQQQPFKLETYGNVPKGLVDRNFFLMQRLESHMHGAQVVNSLVAVSTQNAGPKKFGFWNKQPPKSITFIALAANPPEDRAADNVSPISQNEQNSLHTGVATLLQVRRGGGLKADLLDYRNESDEKKPVKIVNVKIVKHKMSGDQNLWVPVVMLETKTAGETGTDRIVLASFWNQNEAETETATLKTDLREHMGEGNVITSKVLEEFVSEKFKGAKRYSPHVFKALSHLGRKAIHKKAA